MSMNKQVMHATWKLGEEKSVESHTYMTGPTNGVGEGGRGSCCKKKKEQKKQKGLLLF